MAKSQYEQIHAGDVFPVTITKEFMGISIACCSCGLVHDVSIRQAAEAGKVEIKVETNNRATG